MGEAGRLRARDHFDEHRVVGRVVGTYRRLAREKGLSLPDLDEPEITIRPATAADATVLARLHSDGINTGFLPRLGMPFMTRLYRAMVAYEDGLVLVADDGHGPVGFVAGVLDTGAFYKEFIRHHGVAAGLVTIPKIVRPGVARRVWESLTYTSNSNGADGAEHARPEAELLATAVIARMRGRGLGTRLGTDLLNGLKRKGADSVQVVVGADNERAIAAYRKMGFTPSGTTEVHEGELSAVMTWSA
jgi:ribosomal protein S18 acetylase RimI-like enzyme